MRDLYATTMQLVHVGGGEAFDLAAERALDWAWRVDGQPPNLIDQPNGRSTNDVGDVVVGWSSFGPPTARAVEVRLQHPHDGDKTLFWQAAAEITEIGGSTRATVRLALGASVFSLRPLGLTVRAPGLVQKLMDAPLRGYAGSMELDSSARVVRAADVQTLTTDVLAAEERALPVIVAASGVDPRFIDALVRGSAGLAQIVRAHDAAADKALRDALSGFSVPRGGLRLFWPGFGTANGLARYPYWTSAQLRAGGTKRGTSVVDRVVRILAPISTARVPLDRGVLRARQESLRIRQTEQREREEAQRSRARRQRESARQAKQEQERLVAGDELDHLRGRVTEMEALLDLAESERDEANGRAKDLGEGEAKAVEEAVAYSERVDTLQAELGDVRRALRAINEYKAEGDSGPVDEDPIPESVDSWGQIAEHVPDLEGPGFVLTEQALSCAAGKSRYPRPADMWRSLRALEVIGRAYNEMGADIGTRFEEFAMKKGGLDVALQDSTYGEAWFEFEDCWYERVPHVKIDDAKAPNEVGRIYFALDSDGGRVIVDWFGTKPDRPNSKRTDSVAV